MERETKAFYNAVGNRQQVTDNGQITGYTANHLNQYTAVDECFVVNGVSAYFVCDFWAGICR